MAPRAHARPAAPVQGLPGPRHARPPAVPAAATAGPGCHSSEHLLRPEAARWHEVTQGPLPLGQPSSNSGLELDIPGRDFFSGLIASDLARSEQAGRPRMLWCLRSVPTPCPARVPMTRWSCPRCTHWFCDLLSRSWSSSPLAPYTIRGKIPKKVFSTNL